MGGINWGYLGIAPKSWNKQAKNFFEGTPETRENVSLLREEQEPLYQQAVSAGMGRGAGGAFGTSGDYYRDILEDNPELMNQFMAPEMRRYNEEIIPGISEQFAGMGAGGLSSSGFRNAQIQGATDLSERIAAMRANLKQQAAQGLMGIGQQGLQNYSQNMVTQQGSPGFFSQVAPAAGQAAMAYMTGGLGGSGGMNAYGAKPVGMGGAV